MKTYRGTRRPPDGATHFNEDNKMFYRDLEDQPLQRWSDAAERWLDSICHCREDFCFAQHWSRVQ